MRATQTALALCAAAGASAAILPATTEIETRAANNSTWYFISLEGICGSSFGCNYDYVIVGAPDAIPGAPLFALRCNSWTSCESVFPGSTANAKLAGFNIGPLTISQTFTSGGKTTTAHATVDWSGNSITQSIVPVTYTVS